MNYAMSIVPVAHVRLTPDHRAEMVNQLLFGESVKVVEVDKNGWIKAESISDGYRGFCRLNQFVMMDKSIQECAEYTGDWVEQIHVNDQKLMIPFGSNLSLLNAVIPGYSISYNGNIFKATGKFKSEKSITEIASIFLNSPYLWGGKSVFGIDCSGFVQSVFKMMNIVLPRDADVQAGTGEPVGFLQEAVCGDLAFFDDENGDIIHVGILLNEQQIIHASGKVRIDMIDNEGIINGTSKKRTHHLRLIKKII